MAGVPLGLKDLHYALLTEDSSTTLTYAVPVKITGAINAKISTKVNVEKLYSDDATSEIVSTLGDVDVEIETKDLPLTVQAALLGHTVTAGVMVQNKDDIAPYVAIGFKSKKSNGKYRFVWLLKGNFEIPESENATEEDKPKFQTAKIKGSFIPTENNGNWKITGDEDETGFLQAETWFNAVVAE